MTIPAYRDASLSVDRRVADLLARMTIEEKAGQLTQYFHIDLSAFGPIPEDLDIDSLPPEHQVVVRQPAVLNAALAAGGVGSVLFVSDPGSISRLQRQAIDGSRHGIPLLFAFDVIHGFRTIFPVPIGQAATWDPELVEAAQSVTAREARAVGIHWTFAPMVDVCRDPRWGRIVEGPGEDPYLASAMAAAQVRGFQADLGPESILAGPKHFAGYGAARGGRDYDDAEISDSELWNVYLPPFKAAIEAGAGNIMSAYMDLNGVPGSANAWLLNDVLRGVFGFEGFVVSDNNAVRSLETQHFARDLDEAAARALTAGLDMEMAMTDPAFTRLPDAVARGLVDEARLNTAVGRVLAAKFRLGLFEQPFAREAACAGVLGASEHRELARRTAERSAVLLKNDGLLPLDERRVRSIAVIGQLADSKRDTLGPWVFKHDVDETVTLLEGLRSRAGTRVEYAVGAAIPPRLFPSPFDLLDPTIPDTPEDDHDDEAIADAVELAAAADIAVVVVGQRQNQIGETASTATLDLPGRQLEMLRKVHATGTPVVLVVMSGRPLDLRWADEHVNAILHVWYPGTRGGDAVASLLFGDVSPAGRLPFTWPRHVGHVPMIYSHNRTFAPQDQGKRYWEEPSTPLYAFGHGLSYASFSYSDLRAEPSTIAPGVSTTISIEVTNTSARTADEVVQLYLHQRHGTSSRPIRELKGFRRISLEPAESTTIEFVVGPDELSYWSAATRSLVADETTFDVWVGADSTAECTTTIEVNSSLS